MPAYLLTGPEGQRFNLTVPEGTDQATIPETLSKAGAFEGLGKPETSGLEPEKATPELATDRGGPQRIRMMPGLLTPGNQSPGAGVPGRGFASPRQIRSHLDELSTALREGRITEEQYGDARVNLGMPREQPSYLRPREVAPESPTIARPRLAEPERPRPAQEVNERTLAEMRTPPPERQRAQTQPTEQQMRQFLTDRLGFVPAGELEAWARAERMPGLPSRAAREGILGGDRQARDLFQATVAPHQDEATFVQSYFNGAYSPGIRFTENIGYRGERGLRFDGDLVLNGDRLGSIQRQIYPEAGYAYNEFLGLKKTAQAGGFAKGLMANQFDLYRKMGLERVDVFASIDIGGYSWAKYGFLPTEKDWRALKDPVGMRLTSMRRLMSSEDFDMANTLLSNPDPRAIWVISDMGNPIEHPSLKNPTVGKALLAGMDWHGEFRFDNPGQNTRFDRYVAKRQ